MKKSDNKNISLTELGYNPFFEQYRKQNNLENFNFGRIVQEHKERYLVKTETGDFDAEIIGNLRFTAQSRLDFPAVGDWVAITEYDDNKALIYSIFPRETIILRKAVGKDGEPQIVACNVDTAFIILSVNRDFNLNRIERYLSICNESKVEPVIIISKIDLISKEELEIILESIENRLPNITTIALSNIDDTGLNKIKSLITKGKTYCMLGSSGVGKSTLINKLAGSEMLKTKEIGEGTDRGKHTTTHRELIVLENGGIFIDNPGMREIGMTNMSGGIEQTFQTISDLASNCKYKDCKHLHEKGCAIIQAVDNGEISYGVYENYIKLNKEKEHFESSSLDRKNKGKKLSRLIKTFKKKH